MNMNCGVYTITSPSGNQYVGSSVDIAERWGEHKRGFKKKIHHSRLLQRAWEKYGDQLVFKKLLICSREDLLFYEQRALDILKPAYNSAKKAGNTLGVKHSEETKAKLSAALKGKNKQPRTPEQRARMAAAQKGKKHGPPSPITRLRISLANRGKKKPPWSDEARARMSRQRKGVPLGPFSPEHIAALTEARRRRGPHSQETKAKMSATHTGMKKKPCSPETKAKISVALKKLNANNRRMKQMPIQLNDAAPQKTFEVIPDGQFAKILLQVKPGGYTFPGAEPMDNGLFREPKSADAAVTMECELTVLEGPYAHRKWTEYWTVAGGALDDKGHSKGWGISKTRIRAAIESNQGIKPDDMSAQAVATRQINGFSELQNLWFFAKIGVDPGNEYTDQITGEVKQGFDKNKIDRIVTPDMVEYADMAAGKPVEPKPSGRQRKAAGTAASAPGNAPARSWGGAPAKTIEQPSLPNTAAPASTGPKPSWLNKG